MCYEEKPHRFQLLYTKSTMDNWISHSHSGDPYLCVLHTFKKPWLAKFKMLLTRFEGLAGHGKF